jgi:pimeloyl-ACP methyl ester carboxylesterase
MPTPAQVAGLPMAYRRGARRLRADVPRDRSSRAACSGIAAGTESRFNAELQMWSGRRIDVRVCSSPVASDWGIHQKPGVLRAMASRVCGDFRGACIWCPAQAHWVQQEQPQAVLDVLLPFLVSLR